MLNQPRRPPSSYTTNTGDVYKTTGNTIGAQQQTNVPVEGTGFVFSHIPIKRITTGKITAGDIAAWIISFCNERGDPVTNLKLQRLLYYAQAWHLALRGRRLFKDDFQAWANGPIQPNVYAAYHRFSFAPIGFVPEKPMLPKALEEFLKDVLRAYGHLSAFDLESLSCSELPWSQARSGLAPDAPSHRIIDTALMQSFYRSRLNEQAKG
jgi:uncharacterized phage-associated protein